MRKSTSITLLTCCCLLVLDADRSWCQSTRPASASHPSDPSAKQVLVTVNDLPIRQEELTRAFHRSPESRHKDLPTTEKQAIQKYLLETLINDRLVEQYLTKHKIAADPKRVDVHVAALKKRLKENEESFDQFLKDMMVSEKEMTQELTELHRWLAFVEKQATEAALKKYFEANRDAFDGSMVRARHLLVSLPKGADQAAQQKAKREIEGYAQRIKAGESLADLAKKHSDCPSKSIGGDVDFFVRKGVWPEEFSKAAFGLKVGEVSPVVKTDFGYHLILVTEQKKGRPIKLEDVKDAVKSQYADDLRQAVIQYMRARAKIDYKTAS